MKFSLSKERGAWRYRFRPSGRAGPQESSPRFETKSDALAWLDINQTRIEARGRMRPGERLTLEMCVERWLASGRGGEVYRAKAKRTLKRLFDARMWIRPEDITRANAEPLTIDQRRLLLALVRWGIDGDQPFDQRLLRIPPVPRPKRVEAALLTTAEVEAMLARAAEWGLGGAALAHCVATYGHRPESLARATVGDLDGNTLWLWVKGRRGGDRIAHPLLPQTAQLLKRLVADREPADPLFPCHDGSGWDTGQKFAQWWHHYVGKGIGIYRLKQYAISAMLGQGLDVKTISAITGHRCPEVLLKYARTNDTRIAAALKARSDAGVPGVFPQDAENNGKGQ